MNKKVLVILMVLGILIKTGVAQATDVSGTITTDTTYNTTNSPYIVTGDVIVNAGVTLTIEPGVIVKFATNTSLIAYGKLLAVGEQVNKIVFTSYEDETNGQGTSTIAQAGNWMGIKLAGNGANESEIKYCIIKYGKQGIYLENTTNIQVANSFINKIQGDENNTNGGEGNIASGIYLHSVSNSNISSNILLDCKGGAGVSRNYSTNLGDNGCMGVGIYIDSSTGNVVSYNSISGVSGGTGGIGSAYDRSGKGGTGTAIYLSSSNNNEVKYNTLSIINGGVGSDGGYYNATGANGEKGIGLLCVLSNNNTIGSNNVSFCMGGNGGNSPMADAGYGGSGVGICLFSSVDNSIINNISVNNKGGNGGNTDDSYGGKSGNGGIGAGIYLSSSGTNTIIRENIVKNNMQGLRGNGPSHALGQDGEGVGIYCVSSEVSDLSYNNIYDNQTYNLATDISPVPQIAEYNWRGTTPPNATKFSGNVDYDPWLTGTYPSQAIFLIPTPTFGTVGSYVTVFGNGFAATEPVRLDFGTNVAIDTATTNSNGTFATTFIVDTQPCGSTTIRATGLISSKTADAVFFILPKISVVPAEGTIGCIVTVAGNGYLSNEMIQLDFGTTPAIANVQSDNTGSFMSCFITDIQPYGVKIVAAIGLTSNVSATAAFAIKAKIVMVIPMQGTIGTCISLAGNGFGSAESICVSFGTTPTIVTGITSINGTFATTFAVNTQACGPTTITVRGIDSLAMAAASFNISSCLVMISPTTGTVGTMVRTMGNGFAASEMVRLSFGNVATINTVITDATGRIDTSFSVNTQSAGTKTIMATGMTSGNMVSSRFYIMPKIDMLAPTQGTVGTRVTISGNGFANGGLMQIAFGTTSSICSVTSNVDGAFSAAFIANTQPYGTTAVRVIDPVSCLTAPAAFRILPHIILITPTNGQIGTFVTVAGNGFGATEAVGIEFGTTRTIAVGNTMSDGRFHAVFTVDNQPMGATTLIVRGLSTNTMDSDLFMILPSVTLKITPLTQNIVKGQEFTAQVEVVDVGQLVTADIWINFNPDILEAVSAGSGTFMQNCSSPGYWIGTGTIKYSFGSFGSPSTGSGVLCFLRFKARERGIANVTIDDSQTKLYTAVAERGVEIPYVKRDAAYNVISGIRVQPQDRIIRADEYVSYQCISDGDSWVDVTGYTTFTASGSSTSGGGGDFSGNIFHAKYMGSYTITAVYLGLTCTTSAIITPGTPTTISYVSGNNQANTCTATLNEPFVVRVVDVYDNLCPGVGVNWQVIHAPSGAAGYSISPTMTTTNIQGTASSSLTLGTEPPGTYAISAICSGLSGSPITFTANSLRRFGTIAGVCLLRLGTNRYGTCSDILVTILETGATTTTNNNSYFAFSHLPVGAYTLVFDTWGASCDTVSTVNISPTQFEDTTSIGTVSVLVGDVNDDGKVNTEDWPLFGSAWREGATFTNSNWSSYREGDFDHSLAVNGGDFIVLRNNFGKEQESFTHMGAPSMPGMSGQGVLPMQPLKCSKAISSGQIDLSFNLSTLEGVDINDLRVGNTIYLKIDINDATDFMAGEVHLSFNPNVLEVIDSLPKTEGVNIQPGIYPTGDVWSLINNADNILGKIDYAVGTIDPQTGDGGLFAVVPFRIKAYGATAKVGFDFAPEENRTTMFVEAPKAVDNKPVDLIKIAPVEVRMEKQEVVVVVPMRYSNLDLTKVYPNPVTAGQEITFAQLTAGKEKTIKIYTINGELVREFSSALDSVQWIVPTDLASGIYLYLIDDHAGSINQGKIGIIK